MHRGGNMCNPVIGFFRTLALFMRNRVRFDPSAAGRIIEMPDGASFTVFRRVTITVPAGTPEPGAYFLVRFRPAKMSVEGNIRFSRLPMLVFMGFTGFRSKYWAVDRATGLCQGLYEWQTMDDAVNYSRSVAMRFMTKRSAPGSVESKIIDRSRGSLDYMIKEGPVIARAESAPASGRPGKTARSILIAAAACAAAALCGIIAINLHVIRSSERFIIRSAAPPRASAVLVPGAAVWRGGRLSHVLEDRAVTALALYRKKAVEKILVSGDHGTRRYDEVNALRKFFLERGVRPADLFLDHAGFDTYSTMARASKVFAARDLVIVTQEFHLHRAVYLARKAGLDARGFPADRRRYVNAAGYRIREYFARVKAFANVLAHREPRYLGRTIPLTGDGRASWD